MKVSGVSHETAPAELREQPSPEKLHGEDDRLSAEERNHYGVSDPFATSSNLLPTAA